MIKKRNCKSANVTKLILWLSETMIELKDKTCHYAGIPAVGTHVLRHQFATLLLEEGSLSLEYTDSDLN